MSILEKAREAQEISRKDFRFKALLMSPTGGGKSTLATTIPGRKLVLDYDGRSESLIGMPGVKVLQEPFTEPNPKSPSAWQVAEKVKEELWSASRKGLLEYDVVIEDGLSSMNRICMNWALLLDPKKGLGGSPAKQHYGPHIKNLTDHIISMIALPVHYVLTGHFNLSEDEETGAIAYLPKVYGKQMRTDVPGWFNEVYYCYHSTDEKSKREKYHIHTAGFGRYDFMKSALNQLGKYWDNPIEVDFDSPPIGFARLLDLRFGKEEKDGQSESASTS